MTALGQCCGGSAAPRPDERVSACPERPSGREITLPAGIMRSSLLMVGAAALALLSVGAVMSDSVELHPTLLDVLWRAVRHALHA